MDNESVSVYQLITRLCETYIDNKGIGPHINKERIQKARSKCYEILLAKTLIQSRKYLDNNSDALCNLLAWNFYLVWECDVPQHAEKLRLCSHKLQELKAFKNPAYSNVVLFLLQLGNKPATGHQIMDTTINRNAVQKIKTDSLYDDSHFHLSNKQKGMFNVEQFKLPKNVLFPSSLVGNRYAMHQSVQKDICFKKKLRQQEFGLRDEGYESPSRDVDDIWEIASQEPSNNHRTWEVYGSFEIQKELPFVCESGSKIIDWLHNLRNLEKVLVNVETKTTAYKVTQKDFVKCVKYLLVGMESHIFKYNAKGELSLTPGTYVEGLTAHAISSFCEDLISCSDCYRHLSNLCVTTKNEQNGYIFLELCTCIKRYLAYYRVAVLSLSDTSNLLTLHQQTRALRTHVKLLASVCKVGPFKESGEIPHGVTLLNYLYEKATSLINQESLMVFYSVIYPCCRVYFRRFLQQWLLEGSVHDPYGEFFINGNSKYINSRGRTYWTRSYTLREDIVPEFLADMRQDILFCGKAMNLLKLCVPNSALCLYLIDKHPNILHCCLKPEQLSTIEHNNTCYYFETTALSGPRISLQDIICRSREHNRLFLHLVAKKRAATLTRIELARKKKLQQEFDKKQLEMNKLREQYNEALMYKSITVAKRLEREMQIIENNLKLQVLHNKIIEEEKAEIIDYYNKLTAESEQRWNYHQRQIEHLKSDVSTVSEAEFELATDIYQATPELGSATSVETVTSTSYHTLSGDYESKSEYLVSHSNTNLSVTEECDEINANTNTDTDIYTEEFSENYQHYLENRRAAERNRAKVLNVEMGQGFNPLITKKVQQNNLTEAQKNKIKVMSSEYGIALPIAEKITKGICSALEINRNRMLSSDCFNMYQVLDNPKKTTDCDNENFLNRNIEVDTNTNIIEPFNEPTHTRILDPVPEQLHKSENKKHKTLSLDFSKLKNKNDNENLIHTLEPLKFELQKLSPMSIDSATLSTATTPNINMFDNARSSPTVTTARTEAQSDDSIFFECDSMLSIANFQKLKSKYSLERQNEIRLPQQMSSSDAETISPGCLKFCLQQSVLMPLITQIQLVTNELLKYYINDLHYLEHLNSLRNYFFLLDGEFCRNITEGMFSKLYDANFPIDLINVHTLQILVYNALDYSTKFQENSECLSFKINNLPKVFNLCNPDVFDCVSLVYKVSWPLNILLPMDTLSKYDDIFKLLLKVHRVSWILHLMFQDLKLLSKEVERPYRKLLMSSQHYLQLHHYRHIMTQFIHSLQNYIVGEILHSSWHVFKKNLESVQSFDQLYVLHSCYIKNILFLCLLNQKSAPLRTALQKIFVVILKFYRYLTSRSWNITDDNIYTHPNYNKLESLFKNFEDLALYFFKLGHKVVKSGYQPQLLQLLDMLDVNNYYSKTLNNMSNTSI